jgi:hypothetical protein
MNFILLFHTKSCNLYYVYCFLNAISIIKDYRLVLTLLSSKNQEKFHFKIGTTYFFNLFFILKK